MIALSIHIGLYRNYDYTIVPFCGQEYSAKWKSNFGRLVFQEGNFHGSESWKFRLQKSFCRNLFAEILGFSQKQLAINRPLKSTLQAGFRVENLHSYFCVNPYQGNLIVEILSESARGIF